MNIIVTFFARAGDDVARDKAEKSHLRSKLGQYLSLTETWRHLGELSDFDTASHLARLQLPLVAFAELDYYVSSEWGIDALEQAGLATIDAQYAAENSTKATIELSRLDHDFRSSTDVCTGAEQV